MTKAEVSQVTKLQMEPGFTTNLSAMSGFLVFAPLRTSPTPQRIFDGFYK